MQEKNKILIIDDDVDLVVLLRMRRIEDKFKVSTALDGLTGIETAQSFRPNVILLDVELPEIDGFEVCRRLKLDTKTSYIPVIIVTAMQTTEIREKAKAVKADRLVFKPYDSEQLMDIIYGMIDD